MTWLERYLKENPEAVGCDDFIDSIITDHCPSEFFDDAYLSDLCDRFEDCKTCWCQQAPEEKEEIDIEAIKVEFEEDDVMPPIMPPEDSLEDAFRRLSESAKDAGRNIVKEYIEEKIANLYGIPKDVYKEYAEKFGEIADGMSRDYIVSASEIRKILDSGARREFGTGAVRDITDGKGRCDLLPIDVVGIIMHDPVFTYIDLFQDTGDEKHLYDVIDRVVYAKLFPDHKTLFLEVAKHFEEGCKKYGENNWRKGIPAHCYIDSAVRHYLKHLRGDKDEPHDKAFVWNILCCIWTCLNKPELNDYCKEKK